MCLIITANEGVEKYSDFLFEAIKKASITNKDGIGYAFKRKGQNKIWIEKGFQDVDKFIEVLKSKKLKLNDELIIHLRIGNKGAKTTDMNHPFVVSTEDKEILKNKKYVTSAVLAHNGTFFDYSVTNSLLSDTYFFTKDFMSVPEIQALLKRDPSLFAKTFKEILKINRIALIFPDDTPALVLGKFEEEKGYLFSNDSYKRLVYNVGGYESSNYYYSVNQRYNNRTTWPNEDEDEDTSVSAKSHNGVQTNISFKPPSHYPDNKVMLDKLLEEGRKLGVKKGERMRNKEGLLIADSKLEIIPPTGGDYPPIINSLFKGLLFPTHGRIMYTPLKFLSNQLYESIFVPTIFNYKHFVFHNPIGKLDINISPRYNYIINTFSEDTHTSSKDMAHWMTVEGYDLGSTKYITDTMWMKTSEIVQYFRSIIKTDIRAAYITVYNLHKRFEIPSHNLLSRLNTAIKAAEDKGKTVNIDYRNVPHCNLLGMKIFANYVALATYEYEIAKYMFYDVQDKDISISFQEAIEAVNRIVN